MAIHSLTLAGLQPQTQPHAAEAKGRDFQIAFARVCVSALFPSSKGAEEAESALMCAGLNEE